jgi:hypothetical protein
MNEVVHKRIISYKAVKNYSSPNAIRVIKLRTMRWAGHVTRMEEMRNVYEIVVGKSERKRELSTPRHRWEDNIILDVKETECEVVQCIRLRMGSSGGFL